MHSKEKTASVLIYFAIIIFTISFFSCGSKTADEPEEKILVRIGDKTTISLNEFLRRAEYTPRPAYCRFNSYLHKKIILNSLIAEKLIALEAGDNSPLTRNEEFQRFIKGRKEQAMRQWMRHVEATQKVKLDTSEINRAYNFAGRECEIAYFSLSDSSMVNKVQQQLTSTENFFEEMYCNLTGDSAAPRRTIKWTDQEHNKVHNALFSNDLKIGQVLDPIKIADDDYLIIKVLGWSDEMAMTSQQRQERYTKVTEKLTEIKANAIWTERLGEIMRGKRLDFDEDTFYKLTELFYPIYFKSDEEERDEIVEKLWGYNEKEIDTALLNVAEEEFLSRPFFTVEGRVWTVDDFRSELMSHPLVFRKMNMSSNEFARQFRLAVADLVRDIFVTEEAYKKSYDRINVVKRNEDMWRDTFVALQYKTEYLRSVGENRNFARHYMAILEERLNPWIDQLQKKYYKQVELDFETFEDIHLTSIDMFVKQPNQPFPYVVPLFPVTTTDNLIEYVKRMEKP